MLNACKSGVVGKVPADEPDPIELALSTSFVTGADGARREQATLDPSKVTHSHWIVLHCVDCSSFFPCTHDDATPRVSGAKPSRAKSPLVPHAAGWCTTHKGNPSYESSVDNPASIPRPFLNKSYIMFLTRLFRRNNSRQAEFSSTHSDHTVPRRSADASLERSETSEMQPPSRRGRTIASFSFFQSSNRSNRSGTHPAESYHRLIELLSRPRVLSSSSERVSTAVRLVDALRQLEEGSPARGPDIEADRHTGPMSLFIALALRELDAIVDAMSYDELWDAFGGRHANLGLKESDLKAMPTRQMASNEKKVGKEREMCAICLEPFSAPQLLRDLPHCCHTFHVDCIDTWLRKKADCPVCRGAVAPSSM
jgi:hypothetical protein